MNIQTKSNKIEEAVGTLAAALPDPSLADLVGLARLEVTKVVAAYHKACSGQLSASDAVRTLTQGLRMLPTAWKNHGGVPEGLEQRLRFFIGALTAV